MEIMLKYLLHDIYRCVYPPKRLIFLKQDASLFFVKFFFPHFFHFFDCYSSFDKQYFHSRLLKDESYYRLTERNYYCTWNS